MAAKLTQNDRVGFHYSVMCLAMWPILLWLGARDAGSTRRYVEHDIAAGLYSRIVFVIVDQIMDIFSSVFIWLAYLVPSYAMSGLYTDAGTKTNGFILYLGYMLLYFISIQMLVRAVIYLVPMERTASVISGFLLLLGILVNGVMLQQDDLPPYLTWLQYISPSRWTLPELLRWELSDSVLISSISEDVRCSTKRPYQDIIVQAPQCPPPSGAQVLTNYDYMRGSRIWESTDESFLVALAVLYGICALVAIFAFVLNCTDYMKSKEKKARKGHKVTSNAP
ncbi:ABC transporter G family member 16 [Eumeta japonica]|uniref:ABC transporter G family member 16 n=1 Tax=Eumeta variegata TaxID=151549 RepID=A0A4C1UP44_EUMVA|nr:ABC transporter G family member 16 [Eumeta japonica]